MACPHPNFDADVVVNRFEDTGAFNAEVTIKCSVCEVPFQFVDPRVPYGLLPDAIAISVDRTELRCPLVPADGSGKIGALGYTMREPKLPGRRPS